MNGKFRWIIKMISAFGLLGLAACAMVPAMGGSGATGATATQEIHGMVASPVPTEALPTPEVSTAVVSGTAVVVSPGPTETPAPQPTRGPDQQLVITLASDNQTYHLKVGQRFLVNLGMDTYNWDVTIADQSIASRVIGVMVIRGAQGLYEARAPGTTTLTATGDPLCRQSKPACMMPSRMVRVTLIVE